MYKAEDAGSTSLYRQNIGPTPSFAPIRGQHDIDVVIIGGGLTGLSAALHLAEAGTSVAVLEARQPGWGASGRNGGQLNPGLKYNPDTIVEMFGAQKGKGLVDLAWGGPDFTFSLIRRLGIECDARQNGTLRAASHCKAVEVLKQTALNWQQYGMSVKLLGAGEIEAATGTARYRAAMFDPRGGDVNPLKFTQGLAAAAASAGAMIFGDSEVFSLTRNGPDWEAKTASASIRARRVLIATNGYTDDLLPSLRRSVIPVFSAIAATEPLSGQLAAEIMPTRSVLYESGNITVYYRIDAENRLLMGGRGPMTSLHSSALLPNLTRYACRLWPALHGVRWTNAWNGRVAMTEDHLPHFHNPAENLFACLGYNGRGVALSTSLGPALAKLLRGGAVEDFPLPATPIKPIAFHRFWPIGAKIAIWNGRIKDRLGI
ncbi:NAD(P)/FAD-dependent oxidoreductase [Neorhizobium alkalisoli]|uniref:Glycine/D-amino acid oxidase-like deaminating enzyme n=1 Tax=Neorhizobium alkalisoli TaxID=528178 RepID=A0A561R845_9HYPH|nr:FAD-binding oxidoreductase [Neorhizobium alkalisoli]TWF58789.1 glycine/D-amino acid oxidase-like deaminating enzyme [Neorhizobium alkalisoli]